MGFLEAFDRTGETFERQLQELGILFGPGRLVRGNLGEARDALRFLAVRFGQLRDFGFQRAQQLQQFLPALRTNGLGRFDA